MLVAAAVVAAETGVYLGFDSAAGARGSMPRLRMGEQLEAEDFGESSVGQRLARRIESHQYGIGSLSYAGEPGLKLPQS
ncbi:MAG: hypothetical protein FD135_2918 [Comamonadaceae bacterium]|nr:MAG: hypothetical protein FD135_2918 [Comamonadaceae bacterium]